jgi:glycosyltransferase involved in cell wall biosynthesis
MKIAIPVLGFGRSGGYRVLSELASAWVKKGHEVTFVCGCPSDIPYFPTMAQILWLDERGEVMANCSPRKDVGGVKYVASGLHSLLKGLNRYGRDYDIVLANQSLTAWPVFISSLKAKKFYYIQAYEPEYYAHKPGIKSRILEMMSLVTYFFPLFRIVNSPIYFRHKALRAENYVPPGVDFALFSPREKSLGVSGRPVVLGCIGRKEIEKGTRYVFDAFETLLRRGFDVELHVAYGNLTDEQTRHPRCKVVVPGNDRELGEFYRSLDIMIAPGLVQLGAPHYPVMEAMACGIPVVTTGYLPASESNSWIVPVGSSEAIAAALVDIIEHPLDSELRVQQALEDISPFEWDRVAQKMLDMFKGC